MNTDLALALEYAPILHFDEMETIPLRAVGCTVFRASAPSHSFPGRRIEVPDGAACVIEYAYYYDYDIQHLYDLEHAWVTVGLDGQPAEAEGSFHGKYLRLLVPEISGSLPPDGRHVHAFAQPGKHGLLAAGELTRLYPDWDGCCGARAGGPVLIGNPFSAAHTADHRDLYSPTPQDDANSLRYLREKLAFRPSLRFRECPVPDDRYMPWQELFRLIPGWIRTECRRLAELYEA